MNLVNFRRLAPDPESAAQKIQDKIELLEEQGFNQKVAGIKAWRRSPLNQLYLALSHEAFAMGEDMAVILEEKKSVGGETLKPREFEAILQLNTRLSF